MPNEHHGGGVERCGGSLLFHIFVTTRDWLRVSRCSHESPQNNEK